MFTCICLLKLSCRLLLSHSVPCTSYYYIINENEKEIKCSAAVDPLAHLLFYYSTCPSIMWVNLEHTELETPICGSQDPPLAYVGLMTHSLSSSNSRKSCPFFLLSLNDFFHVPSRRLHSFFLLNKNEFFLERVGGAWAILASSSTMVCLGHFSLLEQYQNCIELCPSLSRNALTFMAIEMMDF